MRLHREAVEWHCPLNRGWQPSAGPRARVAVRLAGREALFRYEPFSLVRAMRRKCASSHMRRFALAARAHLRHVATRITRAITRSRTCAASAHMRQSAQATKGDSMDGNGHTRTCNATSASHFLACQCDACMCEGECTRYATIHGSRTLFIALRNLLARNALHGSAYYYARVAVNDAIAGVER